MANEGQEPGVENLAVPSARWEGGPAIPEGHLRRFHGPTTHSPGFSARGPTEGTLSFATLPQWPRIKSARYAIRVVYERVTRPSLRKSARIPHGFSVRRPRHYTARRRVVTRAAVRRGLACKARRVGQSGDAEWKVGAVSAVLETRRARQGCSQGGVPTQESSGCDPRSPCSPHSSWPDPTAIPVNMVNVVNIAGERAIQAPCKTVSAAVSVVRSFRPGSVRSAHVRSRERVSRPGTV